MLFSRKINISLLIAGILAMQSVWSSGPVNLLKRHRYQEAIDLWERDLNTSTVTEDYLRALKGQAVAYFQLGKLYSELQNFGKALMEEYYGLLIPNNSSGLAHSYLGQLHYYNQNWDQAEISLEKALGLAELSPEKKELTEIFLHYSKQKAAGSFNPYPNPVQNESSAWQLAALDPSMEKVIKPEWKNPTSERGIRCQLSVAVRQANPDEKQLEKYLEEVLKKVHKPEMILNKGKDSQINFYDPSLLTTLANGYYSLSKSKNLQIDSYGNKFSKLAGKFKTKLALAEVSIFLSQLDEADKFLKGEKSEDAELLQAHVLAKRNKNKEAKAILDRLAKTTHSPALRRDIAECYYLYNLDLEIALKLSAQASRERDGSSYKRLYATVLFGLGEYDLAMKQYAKGYKIAYRNRIDHIDPEYMVQYAFAVFRTNKLRYDEVVETLYHLQKEFPACRQMYYAMQGISAGLNRGYESQKIFRKGG